MTLQQLCITAIAELIVADDITGKQVPKFAQKDVMLAIHARYPDIADTVTSLKFGVIYKKRADNMIEKCVCKYGKLHGTKRVKRGKNIMSEVEYIDGKKQGQQYEFYEEGIVHRMMTYKDGKLCGFDIGYNSDGSVYRVLMHGDQFKCGKMKLSENYIVKSIHYPGYTRNGTPLEDDYLCTDGMPPLQ